MWLLLEAIAAGASHIFLGPDKVFILIAAGALRRSSDDSIRSGLWWSLGHMLSFIIVGKHMLPLWRQAIELSAYGPATMRETPHIFEGTLASLLDGPTGPHYPCVSLRRPQGAQGTHGAPFFQKVEFSMGGSFFAPHPSQWTWAQGAPLGPVGAHRDPWGPLGPFGPWGPQGSASHYYRLS